MAHQGMFRLVRYFALGNLDTVLAGTGMAPATCRRATEALFTTKPDRLGLGLAIVRETAHRLGGDLRLRSGPDTGTVATLSLPATSRTLLCRCAC